MGLVIVSTTAAASSGETSIEAPAVDNVLDAARRLSARGLSVALESGPLTARLSVEDPWGNLVTVATPTLG